VFSYLIRLIQLTQLIQLAHSQCKKTTFAYKFVYKIYCTAYSLCFALREHPLVPFMDLQTILRMTRLDVVLTKFIDQKLDVEVVLGS
jgi:hypothetical protein